MTPAQPFDTVMNMTTTIDIDPAMLSGEHRVLLNKAAKGTKGKADWLAGLGAIGHLAGWQVKPSTSYLKLKEDNNSEQLARRDESWPITKQKNAVRDHNLRTGMLVEGVALAKGEIAAYVLQHWAEDQWDAASAATRVLMQETMSKMVIGPYPAQAETGRYYAKGIRMVVGKFYESSETVQGFLYIDGFCYGTQSAIITAPNGDTFEMLYEPKNKPTYFGSDAFWKWAFAHGIQKAAEAATQRTEAEQKEVDDIERLGTFEHTAICAICERRQQTHHLDNKVAPRMYDHGYTQPFKWQGDGYRSGPCFGSGMPPVEVTPYALEKLIDKLRGGLPGLRDAIAKLQNCPQRITRQEEQDKPKERRKSWDDRTETVAVEYTPESPKWAEVLAWAIAKAENRLQGHIVAMQHYEKKLAGWKRTMLYDETKAGKQLYSGDLRHTMVNPREGALGGLGKRR